MERVRYQERPERFEYRLTEKGMELATLVVALMTWGSCRGSRGRGPIRVWSSPVVVAHVAIEHSA